MITTYSTDTISVRVTPCINGTYQTLVTISGIGVEVALMVWPHHFPYSGDLLDPRRGSQVQFTVKEQ